MKEDAEPASPFNIIPPWVEYELIEKGLALNSVIESMADWGRRWMKPPTAENQ
ncbi:MAG: winged helix-turn-helix transcriptional regulator [Actinobacteria bacterium]|nr:winged helix-turn-helix transcriptional regulator [Actinomycetota bacterium]